MSPCLIRWMAVSLLLVVTSSVYGAEEAKKRTWKDSKELPEMHHLIEVEFPEGMKPPDKFPLDDQDRITCKTCHAIEDMEEVVYDEVDKDDKDFFRGGPYQKMTDFCYNCHDEKENTRENIHQMFDDNGEIKEEQCKFCHKEVLDRKKNIQAGEYKLRMPMEKICFGCHLKTPHLNADLHQVELTEDKLKQWKKYTKENDIAMPLAEGNIVTCVTCHTPHQQGVIDRHKPAGKQVEDTDLEKGVSYEEHHPWDAVFEKDKQDRLQEWNDKTGHKHTIKYRRIKTEVLLRLRAKDGSLCLACHTFKD